jgi:phosphate transport system substrate-binding protein
MPGHHGRHIPQLHHTPRTAISAAAAITILALSACTSTAAGTSASRPAASAAGIADSGTMPTLTGSGSTFDAPFFDLALTRYHQRHPAVTVSYSAVGSSAGIAAFSAGKVNFGATDVPLTAAEQAATSGGPVIQVPVDLGAEVVVYNLSLPGPSRLHLTGPIIARIFLGQITRWRAPAIVTLNPNIDIPDEPITVIHRSDGSGTTYIFSNYLSAADPAWASKVGTGKTLRWPTGIGAEGNPGVASAVSRIPFSIGYVERSYSRGPILSYAAIRNQAGYYTTPTNASIAADAAQKSDITPADFSIVNEPGPASYPICGYSWALIYTRQTSQATGKSLVSLLDWLTHAGQAYAAATSYVPLPPRIQQFARTMLQQATGPNKAHLLN